MTALYLETSALVSVYLEGDAAAAASLAEASAGKRLIASVLTRIELRRVLTRARVLGQLSEGDARDVRRTLADLAAQVVWIPLVEPILERAERPFEVEPIRTLDALHLATMLFWEDESGERVAVFTRDRRIRDNAEAYRLAVV